MFLQPAGASSRVKYLPAESDSRLFGGNSNWRGPIWFPVNYELVRALQEFDSYYGDTFTVECPTGSGKMLTLGETARNLADRLINIFLRDPARGGRRAVWGDNDYFQTIRTGATTSRSMNISTATRAQALAPATKPAGHC